MLGSRWAKIKRHGLLCFVALVGVMAGGCVEEDDFDPIEAISCDQYQAVLADQNIALTLGPGPSAAAVLVFTPDADGDIEVAVQTVDALGVGSRCTLSVYDTCSADVLIENLCNVTSDGVIPEVACPMPRLTGDEVYLRVMNRELDQRAFRLQVRTTP